MTGCGTTAIISVIRFCIEKSNQKNVNIFTVILGIIFIVDLGLRPFLGSNFIGK